MGVFMPRKPKSVTPDRASTRGHFPNDEAATKLIWLALRNITAKWERGPIHWKTAMNQFAILYEDRFLNPNA
jgi:transposase-like protein